MEQKRVVNVNLYELANEIYQLGNSYHEHGEKGINFKILPFNVKDIKNKFHAILRKHGVSEYVKHEDGTMTGASVEYIMCHGYLMACLFEHQAQSFQLAMMCFTADGDED